MTTQLTKEAFQALLAREDRVGNIARERALLILLANQTFDEVRDQTTKHLNDKGFQPMDARMMTSLAQWVKRSIRPEGERLSEKQHKWLLRENARGTARIGKYTKQLLSVAKEKQGATA